MTSLLQVAQLRSPAETSDGRQAATEAAAPQAGLAAVVERDGRLLFRIAFGVLRDVEEAEDAVQETLAKVLRLDTWGRAEDLRGYLARAVWRTALDRSEARRAAPRTGDATEAVLPDRAANPEQAARHKADRDLLHRLIDGLPEDLRAALVLSAIEELPSAEVARLLAIPAATVRTRVARARAELRRRYEAMTQQRRRR